MRLYARFHQADPDIFYQQSEALEFARMDEKPIEPYYLTIDIDEDADEQQKFILVSPLSPFGRENLDSIAIAGCLTVKHCNNHYQDDISAPLGCSFSCKAANAKDTESANAVLRFIATSTFAKLGKPCLDVAAKYTHWLNIQ
jgi:hypothetical protein